MRRKHTPPPGQLRWAGRPPPGPVASIVEADGNEQHGEDLRRSVPAIRHREVHTDTGGSVSRRRRSGAVTSASAHGAVGVDRPGQADRDDQRVQAAGRQVRCRAMPGAGCPGVGCGPERPDPTARARALRAHRTRPGPGAMAHGGRRAWRLLARARPTRLRPCRPVARRRVGRAPRCPRRPRPGCPGAWQPQWANASSAPTASPPAPASTGIYRHQPVDHRQRKCTTPEKAGPPRPGVLDRAGARPKAAYGESSADRVQPGRALREYLWA